MKQNIHPNWHHDAVVTCSCGNSFTTGSMSQTITVDICNACHPFFTGEMRFVDRQGRVDKFRQRQAAAQAQPKKKKVKVKQDDKPQEEFHSYKQLLQQQRKVVPTKTETTPVAA